MDAASEIRPTTVIMNLAIRLDGIAVAPFVWRRTVAGARFNESTDNADYTDLSQAANQTQLHCFDICVICVICG
jgi:hypothetical protein